MTRSLLELLAESQQLGFLGPGPVDAHIPHALAYADATPPPARALDLGAGGGVPGLVLATSVWPETRWTFLDAQRRRIDFLEDAIEALGLADRVDAQLGRAEEAARLDDRRGRFDLVVARSFGAPAVAAECAAPFLSVGGALVVSEPPAASVEGRWPAGPLAELGFGRPDPVEARGVHLVRLRLVAPCPDRYPRRTGIPAKRPLFGRALRRSQLTLRQ